MEDERMENVVVSEEEETKVKKNFDPIGAGVLTLAVIGLISMILRFVGWIKSLVIKKREKAEAVEAEVEVEETAGEEPAKTEEKETKKKK